MEQAEHERIRQQVDQLVRERFPGPEVQSVEVLGYGADPQVETSQLLARVVSAAPGTDAEREQAFRSLHDAHRDAFAELRKQLNKLPVDVVLQFTTSPVDSCGPDDDESGPGPKKMFMQLIGPPPGAQGRPGGELPGLTPVMARLGADDLEILDTLIADGIASSRAEAVRWSLARIRERPAYEQLRARTREINELKSQF